MKKRRGNKKIHINFSNRWLYTLIAFGIILIIGVGVYAYDATQGWHPASQIDFTAGSVPKTALAICTGSQILKMSGGVWACADDATGGHGDGTNCNSGFYAKGVDANGNAQGCAADATGGHGNGANCAAGQYPLGVDANGAVEGCTTETDPQIRTITMNKLCHGGDYLGSPLIDCDLIPPTLSCTTIQSTGSNTQCDTLCNNVGRVCVVAYGLSSGHSVSCSTNSYSTIFVCRCCSLA